ncbi:MAG: ABC transporter permease [Cyanobacteria bacterium SZAS LIN-3]|nr:ABC transporter permease [Cyanobacteria bacterium SZAS LIN-3]
MKSLNTSMTTGLSLLTIFGLLALGPVVMVCLHLGQPPLTDLNQTNISPFTDGSHLLGTDAMGRDLFGMLAWGALGSLSVALVASFTSVFVGNLFGSFSALMGGLIDNIMMRLVDSLLAIPPVILLLTLSTFLTAPEFTARLPQLLCGLLAVTPSSDGLLPLFTVTVAIAATTWLESARVARARVLSIKTEEYCTAALALGDSNIQLLRRHLLPALWTTAIVEATLLVSDAIIMESGLSFLGLGLGPQTPSWGSMLRDAQVSLIQGNWWGALAPGLAIILTVISIHLIGQGFLELRSAKVHGHLHGVRLKAR